jgi:N-acetyl-anhydromuramyl-L-alanine amidase AmpD
MKDKTCKRLLSGLLALVTALSLWLAPVSAVTVPKSAWILPQIVPEGEVDPNPATKEAAELRRELNIGNAEYASFIHGEKGAKYQKYIVIHDTEEELDPTGTVGLWLGKNSQKVATHFVVGRDGTVVQCVSLDKISHHVGWGNSGHNKKFGITEDGRDDGPTGSPANKSYSDYAMGAWSVGIELCHVGTARSGYTREKDYPEAQLQALDKLIAYIDAYFGFESTIITHKEWRTSNSDTSREFEPYLKNYKKQRSHGKAKLTTPALSSLSNSKGLKLKVKWKENVTGTGYELQYSTDKSFQSGVKKKRFDKHTVTGTTLSGLKKKTYYLRLRTVAGSGHSGWSSVKSVRIKK